MNGRTVLVSEKTFGVLTCDCKLVIRWTIKSVHLPMSECNCSTNAFEREPKLCNIHDDSSSLTKAEAAHALMADAGFAMEYIAESHASLPSALLIKQLRAANVSLHLPHALPTAQTTSAAGSACVPSFKSTDMPLKQHTLSAASAMDARCSHASSSKISQKAMSLWRSFDGTSAGADATEGRSDATACTAR